MISHIQSFCLAAFIAIAYSGPTAVAQIPAAALPQPTESLVVLGSATPIPLAESPRAVEVLPVAARVLSLATPLDALRDDSAVFLEQRGSGGGQSDIVLRGGSFSQTLVLLNGFRINDSQTGHHNLDLPLPLDALDSIQVLHGAGSTLHGVDALSGVVDFLTTAPTVSSLRVRAGAGNFGINEESALASFVRARWSNRLTADRTFSTGFIADRDYRNETASNETWIGSRLGITDLFFAASDRAFGAAQFYGDYPSWERTKGWFASARQQLGQRTSAAYAYRRHTDEFVLVRDNPSLYENNHTSTSWQANLHRSESLAATSFLLGLDASGDAISSSNLGQHARNRGAAYVDLDLRPAARRWSLSAGLRGELLSGGAQSVFAPHLAGILRLQHSLKLRASGGYGYRIPSYTDLYYSDPTTNGNPNLKPESSWSGEGGFDWVPAQKLSLAGTAFYARQHNTIDYVRPNSTALWQAVNLNGLRLSGADLTMTWIPARRQTVRVDWSTLAGAQAALHGQQSEYLFNYPTENLRATWAASLGRALTLINTVQLAQRSQQSPYPVWNASLTRTAGSVRPYLRLANLSNTGYQEISGVPMPGRSLTAGLSLWLSRPDR